MNQLENVFLAGSITIVINELINSVHKFAVDEDFSSFLERQLGRRFVKVYVGKKCSITYMGCKVGFTVVAAEWASNSFKTHDNQGNNIYVVYKDTKIKILSPKFKDAQPFLGYHKELQPLYNILSGIQGLQEQNYNKNLSEFLFDDVTDEKSEPSDADVGWTTQTGGILVVAPSGCGKSLLLKRLRCLYHSIEYSRPITDIAKLFHAANARAPCLLLLDDLDTMDFKDQLLEYFYLKSAGVLVIATASNSANVPSELKQSEALGLQITLSRPSERARRQIIQAMLADISATCDDECLELLISGTKSCTARDLNSLVQILFSSICDSSEEPLCLNKFLVTESLNEFRIRAQEKLQMFTPQDEDNQRSFVYTATAAFEIKRSFIGYEDQYREMNKNFYVCLNHFANFPVGIHPPSNTLLYGPPGCGKSYLVREMALKYNLAVRTVTRSDVYSKYFGQTESNMNAIIDQALNCSPCILHFPAFDSVGAERGVEDHEVEHRMVGLLKTRLDGALRLNGLFIVAETTRPDLLDWALIRRGRFHSYLYVGLPDLATRLELCQNTLKECEVDDCSLQIAKLTEGYTVAEVLDSCRHFQENAYDVFKAVMSVSPGTTDKALKRFRKFKEMYGG